MTPAGAETGTTVRASRSVLMVGNFTPAGRPYRQVCDELSLRLAGAGWRVYTASDFAPRLARLSDMVSTAWLRRHDYDAAHVEVFSGQAFLWAEAVCWTLRRAGKPYALTLHGGNLPEFARRHPSRVSRLLGSAAAVTAPSRYLLEGMKRHRGDIVLIPNPIEVSAYEFRSRDEPAPHLVWLRAFAGLYNPTLAVRVLARLVADHPGARLTMVGPDKGDRSLEATRRAADELGVSGRLVVTGGVPKGEVPARLAAGDVFLNTTNVDNTPVSVLEAMAGGLCVVSTDVGGLPFLLGHETDALMVPPDDPDAMAAAVRRVLTEPGLAGRLSRNARAKAEACDWSAVLPRWDSLLRGLAGGANT